MNYTSFTRTLLIHFTILSIHGMAYGQKAPPPALPLTFPPCLQNPATDGITVCLYTRDTSRATLTWTAVDAGQPRTLEAKGVPVPGTQWTVWKARLAPLTPQTRYEYRIHYGSQSGTNDTVTAPYHFTTLPTQGVFRAAIFNDLHNCLGTLEALMKQVPADAYDVSFLLGDMWTDPAFSPSNDSVFRTLLGYIEQMRASEKPLILVRGNHETRGNFANRMAYLFDLPALDAAQPQANQRWNFTVRAGPAWFLAMDTGEDDLPDTPPDNYKKPAFWQAYRKAQVPWLETLIKNNEGRSASWRIFLSHIPLYNNTVDISPSAKSYWDNLLRVMKIDLEVAGHDHTWKTFPKGALRGGAATSPNASLPWPLLIGGGPSPQEATVGLLTADEHELRIRLLNGAGATLVERCQSRKHNPRP